MKFLIDDWKAVSLRARTMWLAYLGTAFGLLLQFPETAVHFQAIADAMGIGAEAGRWIAGLSAMAAVLRISYQKPLDSKGTPDE